MAAQSTNLLDPMEEFHKRLMTAFITNNLESTDAMLAEFQEVHGYQAFVNMLTERRNFSTVGPKHHRDMLQVFSNILDDNPPCLTPEDFQNTEAVLNAHLKAYRGTYIHLAVAFDLDSIIWIIVHKTESIWTNLFTPTDSNNDTPLSLAVRSGHWMVTVIIAKLLKADLMTPFVAESVIQHAIAKLSRRPVPCECRNYAFHCLNILAGTENRNLFNYVSISRFIITKDLEEVKYCVSKRENCYNYQDTNPFHYAVYLYSNRPLEDDTKQLLRLLRCCCGGDSPTGPNDISVMRVGSTVKVNGTAAHFAVARYREYGVSGLIHPGFGTGTKPEKTLPDSVSHLKGVHNPDNSVRQMLQFLHDDFKVDFKKCNYDHKTPLDCLPSDADPFLVNFLITTQ